MVAIMEYYTAYEKEGVDLYTLACKDVHIFLNVVDKKKMKNIIYRMMPVLFKKVLICIFIEKVKKYKYSE